MSSDVNMFPSISKQLSQVFVIKNLHIVKIKLTFWQYQMMPASVIQYQYCK